MNDKEYTYDIDKYTIGVDTNGEDGIGMTVAKVENGEIYFLGNCYGENARCLDLLIKENQQLKLINKEYERLDNGESRGCTITRVDEYDIYDLIKCKDNWNKLKEWVKMEHREDAIVINLTWKHAISKFLDKMQEIEQGSDSNESNNI